MTRDAIALLLSVVACIASLTAWLFARKTERNYRRKIKALIATYETELLRMQQQNAQLQQRQDDERQPDRRTH